MSDFTTVIFPGLGWSFNVPSVLAEFNLFGAPVTIKFYGAIIAFGFLLAVLFGGRMAYKWKMNLDKMLDVLIYGTFGGIIGARLYYVFFSDWDKYKSDPISIFKIWEGGLAIYGGLIGALIAAYIVCKIRKLNFYNLLDLCGMSFLIGQGIGRWGNFTNQEAFGTNTNLPWGMFSEKTQYYLNSPSIQQFLAEHNLSVDPSAPVHPTFLYESLWCLIGFLLLFVICKKFRKFSGQIILCYGVWYGIGRTIFEGLRTDSLYFFNVQIFGYHIRTSQVLSIALVIFSATLLIIKLIKYTKNPQPIEGVDYFPKEDIMTKIKSKKFGTTPDGKTVEIYTIKNKMGSKAEIITYGATLHSLSVPDRNLSFADVLIGFDDLEGHMTRSDYQGQTVGRYANRIADGKFSINGEEYNVTKNEKDITTLHGGGEFSHAIWDAEPINDTTLKLTYESPDGTDGFPGNVKATVFYTLTEENELYIDYEATTDKDTIINLTNHAYFNLNGFDGEPITNHIMKLNADYFTPTDENSIPTGELRAVEGTPFDFREFKSIGKEIHADYDQLTMCKGYDHNFCLNKRDVEKEPIAVVKEESSGRVMSVYTDLPGVQLYTGNFLDNVKGKNGTLMNQHSGFCLETQYYPNTPNMPDFPSCLLKAGQTWKSTTVYKFTVE